MNSGGGALEPIRFRRECGGCFWDLYEALWMFACDILWQRIGFCSAVFPVLINLRHDAATKQPFLGWFRVSRQSTMNDGWQVGPHSWLHAHMFIQRFCSFFDCQWRFSAFWVIVLQKVYLNQTFSPVLSPIFTKIWLVLFQPSLGSPGVSHVSNSEVRAVRWSSDFRAAESEGRGEVCLQSLCWLVGTRDSLTAVEWLT